jgi:hypothetical protein
MAADLLSVRALPVDIGHCWSASDGPVTAVRRPSDGPGTVIVKPMRHTRCVLGDAPAIDTG